MHSFLRRRLLPAAITLIAAATFVPSIASAHPERPSYWPDPAPDTSVTPPAGGEVPTARSLKSAVTGKGPGEVRVVCRGKAGAKSLRLLERSLAVATTKGFRLRPSQPKIVYTKKQAAALLALNDALAEQCSHHSVQKAVNDSANNDRVVIMPGRYTEPRSRKQPVNDPKCDPSLLQLDASGNPAPSYEYQVTCPNDQNLIYIQGREVTGEILETPRDNRQGIPEEELGACVRCNLQIEGSGVRPEDVILDAGSDYEGNPNKPGAKPLDYAKDVVIRSDRSDGIVIRNLLTRGGREFGIYTEETDGFLLDRTKFFWNDDYGQLSFTSDHGMIKNCDGYGSGDAVVYPGAAPETGSQADTSFYPDAPRINTVVKKCDLRGSALGFSGSMGNAVRITRNHVYGNTTGIATDTLSSAGHPGFPADSSMIDHNYIYSNNLDLYRADAPVSARVPVPMGVGIIYAGENDANVHHNWFFDNWRFAAMLFAVPDALTTAEGGEGTVNPGISCPGAPENGISTSCGNEFHDNRLGQVPPDFNFPKAIDLFGNVHGSASGGVLPNGVDFWWDEFPGNVGNCWYENTGPDGTAASVTGPGPGLPPDLLPSNCAASIGNGDVAKEAYLIECSNGPDGDAGPLDCDWWTVPPQPATPGAMEAQAAFAEAAVAYAATAEGKSLLERMTLMSEFTQEP